MDHRPRILLAFSWGHQFPKPGPSNEIIAREIEKIKNDFDYVLVQIEIGQVLQSHGVTPSDIIGEPGVYINTYQVAKDMLDWMKAHVQDISAADIRVICHKTHWSGCRAVFRKLGISAERIPVDVPYDRNSHQWYTRGPIRAFVGKGLHAVGYLLRGELV